MTIDEVFLLRRHWESVDLRPVFFALDPNAATVARLMALWRQLNDRRRIDPIEIESFRWRSREFSRTRSDPDKGIHEKLATWPLSAAEGSA